MLDSASLDRVQSFLGMQAVPEMLYGDNRLYLACPQLNFILSFSPLECVKLCDFNVQRQRLAGSFDEHEDSENYTQHDLNSIDLMPAPIEAHQSGQWKDKDLSNVQFGVVSEIEKTCDWTFASAYKGTIGSLKTALDQIPTEFSIPEDLANTLAEQIPEDAANAFAASIRRDPASVQDLPTHMLGQDNPIKVYGQVDLYEDEFADRGYSKSYVRFRVMHDCFFILQRSYIRIDHVTVRILDTRIFHQFTTDHLIRDFCHKESTYDELRLAGFQFGSEWLLSETQADQVYPFLEEKAMFKDTVLLRASEE